MLISDKADFAIAMTNCFQNFRANISKEMIDEWFNELKGIPLFNIRKSFSKYTNEVEKFPPTRATIIKFSKIQFGVDKENLKNEMGCTRMLGNKNCGQEILVHQLCDQCY